MVSGWFGAGLVGRRADFRGGDKSREGGKGVVDLCGLGGACETRLDEFDRAKDVAAEFDRANGLGAALPFVCVLVVVGLTSDEPGAVGNSI